MLGFGIALPFPPPLDPMLAKLARSVPRGPYLYEPKWDGFRIVVFRDGDEIYLQSRDSRPFLRYFPELVQPLRDALPDRAIVDGEVVVAIGGRLEFDALQLRLHPAASRVAKLAEETPAAVILFDLVAIGDEDLRETPFVERRKRLEAAVTPNASVRITPATLDADTASDWFARFEGAGLDGVMCKPLDGIYEPGKRSLIKTKRERTIECAVAGFRFHEKGGVGSLVLGLFDDAGNFQQIGVSAGFSVKLRQELVGILEPYREGALAEHPWGSDAGAEDERRPGMQSRWSTKDMRWEPLRLELVAEVQANQLTGGRLRHPAHFLRFRPDKQAHDCRYDQLEEVSAALLTDLFGG